MRKRGFHAGKMDWSICLAIFNRVIFPSLMYGRETMPISEHEIANLDFFMASTLSKILHGGTTIGPPLLTLWETGCLPATILISQASHRLLRRISPLPIETSYAGEMFGKKDMINEFFWDNISRMSPFYPYGFPMPVRGAKPSSKKKLNDKMTIASLAWFNDLAENLQTPMGGICETITDITPFPGVTDALLGIPSTERCALMQMKLKLISVPQPPPKVWNISSALALLPHSGKHG